MRELPRGPSGDRLGAVVPGANELPPTLPVGPPKARLFPVAEEGFDKRVVDRLWRDPIRGQISKKSRQPLACAQLVDRRPQTGPRFAQSLPVPGNVFLAAEQAQGDPQVGAMVCEGLGRHIELRGVLLVEPGANRRPAGGNEGWGRSSALATKRIEHVQCERCSTLKVSDRSIWAMASARLGSLRAARGWALTGNLLGQQLMDGSSLGRIDINIRIMSIVYMVQLQYSVFIILVFQRRKCFLEVQIDRRRRTSVHVLLGIFLTNPMTAGRSAVDVRLYARSQ